MDQLGELGQSEYVDDIPVSATAAFGTVGLAFGPPGLIVGALVGGVVDVVRLAFGSKKKLKKLKKEFMREIMRRYNSAIFVAALERMGPAMIHLVELGVKPGTPQFDQLLQKKLFSEIGYKGNCEIDLYGPAPEGQPRPLLAKIERGGKTTPVSPNFRTEHGQQWAQACKEIHKAALKAWAEEQAEQIEFERELKDEQEKARVQNVTKILVNGGMLMFIIGYTLRQKKKVKRLRAVTQ